MITETGPSPVVFTNKAHCRDCYRCLRVCPVKAIRMQDGQAYVDPKRCIACGTCIRECPQGAKQYRNDIDRAAGPLSEGKRMAASVAPSFAAVYSDWERKRLPGALRRLGFSFIGETAVGAYHCAVETERYIAGNGGGRHILTACPAVVGLVEKYDHPNARHLVPIVSPMIAHARHLRKRLGADTGIVFIGPCVAKKLEADRPEYAGDVEAVLTFAELMEWLEREGILLSECEESTFDEIPQGHSRLFPLTGGSIRTSLLSTDLLDPDIRSVTGIEDIRDSLLAMKETRETIIVEPLFCLQGCVNGPALSADSPIHERRQRILGYAQPEGRPAGQTTGQHDGGTLVDSRYDVFRKQFVPVDPGHKVSFPEEEIERILRMTGKYTRDDELNCGACGYSSCREKAAAVLNGMAEPEMCIPYMRRLAEKRTDRIIETSPNGIVILDEKLQILSMNPAFKKFFLTTDAVIGRHISYLMDPDLFENLASGKEDRIVAVVKHDKYGIQCHQILYRLPETVQYIGIFVDITSSRITRERLAALQEQILGKTRELLDHQIHSAQTIAKFLGESSARTEEILEQFSLYAGETPDSRSGGARPDGGVPVTDEGISADPLAGNRPRGFGFPDVPGNRGTTGGFDLGGRGSGSGGSGSR